MNCTHLFVTSTNVNYSMAEDLCRSKQAQLARVDSEEMKTFVDQHLNGNNNVHNEDIFSLNCNKFQYKFM
ncbi:hypothetical protein DPMN_052309 [Dreissena polymorpha]|uniref:C-type lectin domain-containing protein n=1 Tax=Dreissena polymorpha TaxID=45954 RepID=A0A9D4CL22_DREPO|nr:hypothetical protein DPMN_052309 [Dreissena polymorpha]